MRRFSARSAQPLTRNTLKNRELSGCCLRVVRRGPADRRGPVRGRVHHFDARDAAGADLDAGLDRRRRRRPCRRSAGRARRARGSRRPTRRAAGRTRGPRSARPARRARAGRASLAVSASEWKLPRREYARTSSSVTCSVARRSVTSRPRSRSGVNVTHDVHSGVVGRVGGDDRPPRRRRTRGRASRSGRRRARSSTSSRPAGRDAMALQPLAGLDHRVGARSAGSRGS